MIRGFKKISIVSVLSCALLFGGLYAYYYNRWKHLWALQASFPSYPVNVPKDSVLKVVMIGDSWAGIHSELQMDTFLCSKLEQKILRPVSVVSKGKGGEKSRGIYRLLFQTQSYGTKNLFLAGSDYCIISAGINDAAANLGTKQFCAHYRMILDFLFANNIRPVIIEIPDVDIWNIYGDKPKKDLLTDYVRSTMTCCGMYNYHEYREALYSMLIKECLMDKVVYVPMNGWNGDGVKINPSLFMPDRIHLNSAGYKKLDDCIATAIARDLQESQNPALVDEPVGSNAKH